MPTAQMIEANSDWLTVREATVYGKMSRSRLYSLITDQAVRTVSIRRRGRTKGKRYVSKFSIENYFDSQCSNQARR
jgi:hypothetical protein